MAIVATIKRYKHYDNAYNLYTMYCAICDSIDAGDTKKNIFKSNVRYMSADAIQSINRVLNCMCFLYQPYGR